MISKIYPPTGNISNAISYLYYCEKTKSDFSEEAVFDWGRQAVKL